MATIRKRGGLWHTQIRKKGFPHQTRTFQSKAAASSWARRTELSMEDGSWIDTRESRSVLIDHMVDELVYSFERFGLEVSGPKRGQLNQIKQYFEGVSIHDMSLDDVLSFAAHRKKTVCASTLQTQMYYLKQVIENSRVKTDERVVDQAINELQKKKIIMGSKRRDRRLAPGEYDALLDESGDHWIGTAIDIAVESAMRQSEIHRLKWSDIDEEAGVIHLLRKDKKAESGRSEAKIPILKGVREALLRARNKTEQRDNLFHVKKSESISDKFARMTAKIGIDDLRFHDLRHEAISRMFERGMAVEQVRVVSGHRTLDQLSRYINLRAEDLTGM